MKAAAVLIAIVEYKSKVFLYYLFVLLIDNLLGPSLG